MDRKQSAVSRRMANRENETTDSSLTTALEAINEQIATVSDTANSATNLAILANSTANSIINVDNTYSLINTVTTIETNLSNLTDTVNNLPSNTGSTGFDPSDPNEPIVYVENFVFQNAGDPDGDGTGPLPYPDVTLSTLNVRTFQAQVAPSEENHIGILSLKVQIVSPDTHSLYLARTPADVIVHPNDISTNTYIIKTPSDVDADLTHLYLGLVDDFSGPFAADPKGVYVTKDANKWKLVTKDSSGSQTQEVVDYLPDTWFTIIIRRPQTGGFQAEINTVTSETIIDNIPDEYLNVGLGLKFAGSHFQDEFLLIDFFSLKIGEPETNENTNLIATGNIDGGEPGTNYGGIPPFDAGGV